MTSYYYNQLSLLMHILFKCIDSILMVTVYAKVPNSWHWKWGTEAKMSILALKISSTYYVAKSIFALSQHAVTHVACT